MTALFTLGVGTGVVDVARPKVNPVTAARTNASVITDTSLPKGRRRGPGIADGADARGALAEICAAACLMWRERASTSDRSFIVSPFIVSSFLRPYLYIGTDMAGTPSRCQGRGTADAATAPSQVL